MSRIVTAAALLAVLLLVGAFVPVQGVTLVERLGWYPTPASARTAARAATRPGTSGAVPGGPATAGAAARPAPEPVENHTEADRNALDRLVAERAGERTPARKP